MNSRIVAQTLLSVSLTTAGAGRLREELDKQLVRREQVEARVARRDRVSREAGGR